MPIRRFTASRLTCRQPVRRQLASRLLAAASLSALWLTGAHAADRPVTRLLGPGVWYYTTPQLYGPDDVLDLHGTGDAGCSPCYPLLVFQTTVSFGGTLKLTLPDKSCLTAAKPGCCSSTRATARPGAACRAAISTMSTCLPCRPTKAGTPILSTPAGGCC